MITKAILKILVKIKKTKKVQMNMMIMNLKIYQIMIKFQKKKKKKKMIKKIKSINNINIQQINIKTNMPKKKKSHSLMKKNELVFPKINNNNNLNDFDYFDKRFSKLNSNGNNINKKKIKNWEFIILII